MRSGCLATFDFSQLCPEKKERTPRCTEANADMSKALRRSTRWSTMPYYLTDVCQLGNRPLRMCVCVGGVFVCVCLPVPAWLPVYVRPCMHLYEDSAVKRSLIRIGWLIVFRVFSALPRAALLWDQLSQFRIGRRRFAEIYSTISLYSVKSKSLRLPCSLPSCASRTVSL